MQSLLYAASCHILSAHYHSRGMVWILEVVLRNDLFSFQTFLTSPSKEKIHFRFLFRNKVCYHFIMHFLWGNKTKPILRYHAINVMQCYLLKWLICLCRGSLRVYHQYPSPCPWIISLESLTIIFDYNISAF